MVKAKQPSLTIAVSKITFKTAFCTVTSKTLNKSQMIVVNKIQAGCLYLRSKRRNEATANLKTPENDVKL